MDSLLRPIDGPATADGTFLVTTLLALAGFAALAWQRRGVRGTTLVAVWFWSAISLVVLWASEATIWLGGESAQAVSVPLRFAAAMTTFCPTMAVLGAKRPQDRAWQAIVFSLWVILSLPSFEWLFFGGAQEIHPARFWFLVALVAVGALNGLATRYWLSSMLVGLGQLMLCAASGSVAPGWISSPSGRAAGLAAIVVAWWLVGVRLPRGPLARQALDRVWLDFRDAFGAVWGLRMLERINASAEMYDWPVVLAWQGWIARDGGASPHEIPLAVEESVRTLLRRFVSPAWIDQRSSTPPAKKGVRTIYWRS